MENTLEKRSLSIFFFNRIQDMARRISNKVCSEVCEKSKDLVFAKNKLLYSR